MSSIINPEPQVELTTSQIKNPPQLTQISNEIQQVNPITLLVQPELFKQTFLKITKTAQQLYKNKNLEKGLIFFNKAIDMLDIGKNILKDSISKYLKLTVFINLAYGYQNLRKLQKASRFCERAKQQLQKLILQIKDDSHNREKYLKLGKFFVTLKFQHCAIVSQLQQHQKALEMCKSTLPELREQLESMLKYLRQNSSEKPTQKKIGETVQFSKHVQKFAEGMLIDLISFLNEPLKKFHFYYWEKNPELNEEQIRKKFIPSNIEARNQSKRSILGVSKASSWMDEFNIGSIMHMSMVTVQEFEMTLPMEEYYFKDKLYEFVILCSLSYFTMATQIRFLDPVKDKDGSSKSKDARNGSNLAESVSNQLSLSEEQASNSSLGDQGLNKSNSAEAILKKYGYQQRSQMHKLSQLYHLRAIELISRNIQSVIPYLIHIIKSYDKHYLKKKELEPIAAIKQESQISIINQSALQYLSEQNIYNDYMKKESDRSKNDEPIGQLLIQSQNNQTSNQNSNAMSRKKSVEKNDDIKNSILKHPEINEPCKFPEPEPFIEAEPNFSSIKSKKTFGKTNEKPKFQAEAHLYSRGSDRQQDRADRQQDQADRQLVDRQYMRFKQSISNIKSPKKHKNHSSSASKAQFYLVKSKIMGNREKSLTFKHDQKGRQKGLSSYRSHIEQARPMSKSNFQSNKVTLANSRQQTIIRKYNSPEAIQVQHSQHRIKTEKSKQKIFKKIIDPTNKFQNENFPKFQSKKTAKKLKKPKVQEEEKKKQSKYYAAFDGQKQYRIKHQSTTQIKVLYKKKPNDKDQL